MAAVMFDTHAVIKRLQQSGFSEQQAEAVTGVLQDAQKLSLEQLATKQDIQDVRREMATKQDIQEVRRELEASASATKQEIQEVRRELEASASATKQEIQEVRRELAELAASTKRDREESEMNLRREMREIELTLRKDIEVKLAELKADLLKWTISMLLAQIAVIAALVKLL